MPVKLNRELGTPTAIVTPPEYFVRAIFPWDLTSRLGELVVLDSLTGEKRIDHALEQALKSAVVRNLLFRRLGWTSDLCAGECTVDRNAVTGLDLSKGENDLHLSLDGGLRVLFENKFNADFQPRQGERYRARALQNSTANSARPCVTVLTAPSGYLHRKRHHPEARFFHHQFALDTEWRTWVQTAIAEGEPLTETLALIDGAIADYERGEFQGVKGKFPAVHRSIWAALAGHGSWYQKDGNDGDWVHIHHEQSTAFKFHYRIKNAQVDVELIPKDKRFSEATISDAARRNWKIASTHRNIVCPLRRSGIEHDQITEAHATDAARQLDELRNWCESQAELVLK